MTSLRTAETRIAALEAENAELRERLAWYRLTVFGEDLLQFPLAWELRQTEARLLAALLSPLEFMCHDALLCALYPGGPDTEPGDGTLLLKKLVCTLRRKVAQFDVQIRTVWGRGYVIPEPRRSELRLAARQASRPPWEQPDAASSLPPRTAARFAAQDRMLAAR